MMTHGAETDRPVGFGVMTWFSGVNKDFVVLDDTPAPDYQWLYDPSWSSSTLRRPPPTRKPFSTTCSGTLDAA